jgi:hypothetical protein
LRAAQLRAVREQELLSGSDWILICACVHALAMVYPVFLWVHVLRLNSASLNQHLHPAVNLGFTAASGVILLGFWWWAHYARYRAALWALITYILLQGALGYLDPRTLVVGATFKALVILGLIHATVLSHQRHRPM